MAYLYLKAVHIIFVVTWFAGLFYMPRFFIYNTEASEKDPAVQKILRSQFETMMKRLWYGITWPSAILTLIFGLIELFNGGWYRILFEEGGKWMLIKLIFVVLLYIYHFSLQSVLNQELKGKFKYSSQQLRMYNEVATVLLVAIVILATVKQTMSFVWGIGGIIIFIILLMAAINIYKMIREKNNAK
jgi:protoporphyrinogen IX oxidase